MKRMLALTILGAAALAVSAQAGSSTSINIRHQVRGCHTWSVNSGAYKAKQAVKIARGTTITFTNNDVMPHKLVQTHGAKVTIRHANMSHMSARATVRFTKAGVYKFKTKAGEDYMEGMKTIGEDNVLKLTVRVK
jgi:plastocyanin